MWILLSAGLAVVALAVLAVVVLGLWRKVKALSSAVSVAGDTVGQATERLAVAQAAGPLGDAHGAHARPPSTWRPA